MAQRTREPKRKEQRTIYVSDELEDKLARLADLLDAEGVEVRALHGVQRPFNIVKILTHLVDEALEARQADTP